MSTKEQKEDRQVEALKKYGIEESNIFVDKISGKDFNRPEYKFLKELMKRTSNNVLVIKSIDRLGRNYREILREWQELTHELNIDIVVLDMPLLDTTKFKDLLGTFISDLILQVLSFVAEQERENIRTRQAEGIAIAKIRGTKTGNPMGRPRVKVDKNEFEKQYAIWKAGEQSAKSCMEALHLKRRDLLFKSKKI